MPTTKPRLKKLTPEEQQAFFIQRARDDFTSFCYFVEPNYSDSARHLVALHKKLMRIEKGLSRRDQTFMPPQHGKTLTASILFTAWYLGRHPDHKIIFATYSQDLADLRGSEIRAVMQSAAFMAVFPDCVITKDTNAKNEFALTRGGSLVALGRKAGGTGRSANGFILDDITKDQADADSAANRLEVKNFYSGVVMTRLVNKTWIHIINTRWHEDDLSGWTLTEHKHANWDVLTLAALCDDEDNDPMDRKLNEPLWPEQQSYDLLIDKKKSGTPRQWSAIYQQKPVPDGGNIFNPADWVSLDDIRAPGEAPIMVVQSCDTASKVKKGNDPSVIQTWEVYKRGVYLKHQVRRRVAFPQLKMLVKEQWMTYSANLVLVEDKSSGTQIIQELKDDTSIPILAINPGNIEKETRFDMASAQTVARKVAIPAEGSNEWIDDYRIELATVPASKFDDQADATAQFLNWYAVWSRRCDMTILFSNRQRQTLTNKRSTNRQALTGYMQ